MTAGSLLTILFYVWLAVTAFVAFVWYRRKANRTTEKPSSNRLRELNEREANKRVSKPDKTDAPATVAVGARTTDEVAVDTTAETVNQAQAVSAGPTTGISAEDPTIDKPIDLNELLAPEIPSPGSDSDDESLESANDMDSANHMETTNDMAEAASDAVETSDKDALDDGLVIQPAEGDSHTDEVSDEVDTNDDADVDVDINIDEAADGADLEQASSDVDDEEAADDSDRLVLGALPVDEDDTAINLTELLSEFDLPHDLKPLGGDNNEGPDLGAHVTLVSNHGDAADVGTALADELEGLGYNFEPVGHDRGVAKRGTEVIAMRIIPDIGASDASDHYRSSGISESAVVVEMWSGHSSPDQLKDTE